MNTTLAHQSLEASWHTVPTGERFNDILHTGFVLQPRAEYGFLRSFRSVTAWPGE